MPSKSKPLIKMRLHTVQIAQYHRLTYGKSGSESGNGLGVFHACKTVEAAGGIFKIESEEGLGTLITMRFPKSLSTQIQ